MTTTGYSSLDCFHVANTWRTDAVEELHPSVLVRGGYLDHISSCRKRGIFLRITYHDDPSSASHGVLFFFGLLSGDFTSFIHHPRTIVLFS